MPQPILAPACTSAPPTLALLALLACAWAPLACSPAEETPPAPVEEGAFDPATDGAAPAVAHAGVGGGAVGYDPVSARRLTLEAVEHFDDGDLEGARERLLEALEARPAYFEAWRVLAAVEDGLGNRPAALAALGKVAESGLLAGFEQDPRLAALRDDPAWDDLVARVDTSPIAKAEVVARLSERDLVTEDVALDPATGTYYVSSVHRRKVLRIPVAGQEETAWSGDGAWSVLGMALDAERRRLWVTTSAMIQMVDFAPALDGHSSLVALALPDDPTAPLAVAERHDFHALEGLAGPVLLNDVAVGADGTVWVSDHRAPTGLFRLRPGGVPEPFGDLELRSPQGLAVDAEGRVWLADYSYGLAVFDGETGEGRWVHEGEKTCLLGIDGLAHDPASGHLLAIQNVLPPHRILRLVPSADAARIERVEVLERARPDWIEPTLGTVVDGAYFYIGASQWNRFDPEGALPPAEELDEPLVLRLAL